MENTKTKPQFKTSRKNIVFAIIINTMIIAVSMVVSIYIYHYIIKVEQDNCWDTLKDSANGIEDQVNTRVEDNLNILKIASNAIVMENRTQVTEGNIEVIKKHLEDFKQMTMFSRIDILYPDGNMLLQTEGMQKSNLNFNELAAKGLHISSRITDTFSGKESIIFNIPVKKENQTVAILQGIVFCEDFPKIFQCKMYDGKGMVCLVDRPSGDFIMDAWHDTFGNIYKEKMRKTLPGYEKINVPEEVFKGNTGIVAFESKVNGKASYMYFKPIENLNWEMIVVVQEDVVFQRMQVVKKMLIYIAIMGAILLISYLLWMTFTLNNALKSKEESERKSYLDTLTGVYNRNKFNQIIEEYEIMNFKGVGVIFLDLNNLKDVNDSQGHESGDGLIKRTATIISKFFGSSVYRIGGDEFVVCTSNFTKEAFLKRAINLKEEMKKEKINISIGITWREDSSTLNDQIQEADKLMYCNKRAYYKKQQKKGINT